MNCLCLVSLCLLQAFREHFLEELQSYSSQVEEFKNFGELTDLSKYLKKSQNLKTKLDFAMEKVHQKIYV